MPTFDYNDDNDATSTHGVVIYWQIQRGEEEGGNSAMPFSTHIW